MPAFRILGGICLTAAAVLAVAAIVSQPSQSPPEKIAGPPPQIEFRWSLPEPNTTRPLPHLANKESPPQKRIRPAYHARKHREVVAEHHRTRHHHRQSDLAHLSTSTVSEASAPAEPAPKSPARKEVAAVAERLQSGLGRELYADFDLFLYVSKAASGPLAQRMYVFDKQPNGALDLLYDWPVSTGRDRTEPNSEGLEL